MVKFKSLKQMRDYLDEVDTLDDDDTEDDDEIELEVEVLKKK